MSQILSAANGIIVGFHHQAWGSSNPEYAQEIQDHTGADQFLVSGFSNSTV